MSPGPVRRQPLIGPGSVQAETFAASFVKKGTCQRRTVTAPFLQEIWYDIKRKESSVVRRCRHHVQTSANLRKPALCGIVHMLRAFLLLILRCCPACPCMQAGSCRAKTADRRRHLPDRQFGYCLSACRSGRSCPSACAHDVCRDCLRCKDYVSPCGRQVSQAQESADTRLWALRNGHGPHAPCPSF